MSRSAQIKEGLKDQRDEALFPEPPKFIQDMIKAKVRASDFYGSEAHGEFHPGLIIWEEMYQIPVLLLDRIPYSDIMDDPDAGDWPADSIPLWRGIVMGPVNHRGTASLTAAEVVLLGVTTNPLDPGAGVIDLEMVLPVEEREVFQTLGRLTKEEMVTVREMAREVFVSGRTSSWVFTAGLAQPGLLELPGPSAVRKARELLRRKEKLLRDRRNQSQP